MTGNLAEHLRDALDDLEHLAKQPEISPDSLISRSEECRLVLADGKRSKQISSQDQGVLSRKLSEVLNLIRHDHEI